MKKALSARSPWRGLVGFGLVCALFGAAPGHALAAGPANDINTYVLFAYDEIRIHDAGGQSGVTINGGNVGVNSAAVGGPNLRSTNVNINMTAAGSQMVADNVEIPNGSSVFDLFANTTWASFDSAVVRNSGPTAFTTPIVAPADLPTLPMFGDGATDAVANSGQSVNVPPGAYDKVWVKTGGTINLTDGTYDIDHLVVADGATLTTTAGTVVRATREVTVGSDAVVSGSAQTQFLVRSDKGPSMCTQSTPESCVDPSTASFKIGNGSDLSGQVFVPNGQLRINDGVNMAGRFWAQRIVCDCHLKVDFVPPDPPDPPNPPEPPTPPVPPVPETTPPAGQKATSVTKSVPAGSAVLSRAAACKSGRQKLRVRGTSIRRVRFSIDGHPVKNDRKSPFDYTVAKERLSIGAHKLVARVEFVAGSSTKPKTLRTTIQRCASRTITPKFTG